METYPNKLIRGVANSNELNAEGHASVNAFVFRDNNNRVDSKKELSINWCDDEAEAVRIAMCQLKNDGSYQFKAGVAVLSREKLDMYKKAPVCTGKFDYERAPIEGNKYHGNILCQSELPKQTIDIIRSLLVLSVTDIIPREMREMP